MYAQNGAGLGHFRRCANIANALAERGGDERVVIASRSLASAAAFALPASCDVLKLPAFVPIGDDANGERRALVDREDPRFARLRGRLLLTLMTEGRPRAVLVDNEPRGLQGELVAALREARAGGLVERVLCGIRDIRGRPGYVREKWRRDGSAETLRALYDGVLVYGDPALFDTAAAYGLGSEIAVDVRPTGYLFRGRPERDAEAVRRDLDVPPGAALVAVTGGSGADGRPLFDAYLAHAAPRLGPDVISILVAGPLMPAADVAALAAHARDSCRLVRAYDVASLVHAADAVVCRGGYNSLCEAVHAGHVPAVVPRMTRSGEQETRAEVFAAHGLAAFVPPGRVTGGALAASVVAQLERPRSRPSPFDPAASAARAVAALVG